MASGRRLLLIFWVKALATVLKLLPLTKIPAGLWIIAKYWSSNNTLRLNTSFFFGPTFSKMDKLIRSPPCIYVADVAMTSLTLIYCFFSAFFKADFVITASKIPTPYSWSRIGVCSWGTIWDSVSLMMFFYLIINTVNTATSLARKLSDCTGCALWKVMAHGKVIYFVWFLLLIQKIWRCNEGINLKYSWCSYYS